MSAPSILGDHTLPGGMRLVARLGEARIGGGTRGVCWYIGHAAAAGEDYVEIAGENAERLLAMGHVGELVELTQYVSDLRDVLAGAPENTSPLDAITAQLDEIVDAVDALRGSRGSR